MGRTNDEIHDSIEQRAGIFVDEDEQEAPSIVPSDPDARDLHDQEKAQRIEHEDLNRPNKQVGGGLLLTCVIFFFN